MSLTRVTRRRSKTVTLLDEANPIFVSLVGNAANQTPFHSIKSANGMKLNTAKKGLNLESGVDIQRITFSAAKFADEAAVTTYLTEQGFADFAIEPVTEGGFVVKGVDESTLEEVKSIDFSNDGVVFYVGKSKTPEGENATKSNENNAASKPTYVFLTAKGDPIVAKYDYYLAYAGEGKSVAEVLKAGLSDGYPIGFDEVSHAFSCAMRTLVKNNDVAGLAALGAEYGTILSNLHKFIEGSATTEQKMDLVKALFPEPEESKPENPPAPPADSVSKAEFDAMAAKVAELTQALTETTTKSADNSTSTETLQKSVTELTARITQLERLRQTRKSDDPITPPPAPAKPPVPVTRTAAQIRMANNLAGIPTAD